MTLVDTNVLLDLLTRDADWLEWSRHHLRFAALDGPLLINDVIYAELSIRFDRMERLDFFLHETGVASKPISTSALFAAGKVFRRYRKNGGSRHNLLPDFFIGAQAAVDGLAPLTRDPRRYRTYFPAVSLITPKVS